MKSVENIKNKIIKILISELEMSKEQAIKFFKIHNIENLIKISPEVWKNLNSDQLLTKILKIDILSDKGIIDRKDCDYCGNDYNFWRLNMTEHGFICTKCFNELYVD